MFKSSQMAKSWQLFFPFSRILDKELSKFKASMVTLLFLVTLLHYGLLDFGFGRRVYYVIVTQRISCKIAVTVEALLLPYADDSRGVGVFYLHLSVGFFPHDISNIDAARTTKPDIEMFHDESCKTIYFGAKGQDHASRKYCRRGSLHSCECWLLPMTLSRLTCLRKLDKRSEWRNVSSSP